jgi:hypothetical protein
LVSTSRRYSPRTTISVSVTLVALSGRLAKKLARRFGLANSDNQPT